MTRNTVSINLRSRQTVTVVLDIATANNLLLALTNALQGSWSKKDKKKKGKDGKGGKGGNGGKDGKGGKTGKY